MLYLYAYAYTVYYIYYMFIVYMGHLQSKVIAVGRRGWLKVDLQWPGRSIMKCLPKEPK